MRLACFSRWAISSHHRPLFPIYKNFIRHQRVASTLAANVTSLSQEELIAEIRSLENNRDIVGAEKLLEGFSQNMSTALIKAVLRMYLSCGYSKKAFEFFRRSVIQGFQPDITDLESLVHGLLRQSDIATARSVFESFPSYNIKYRAPSFNLWISFYLNESQPEKAKEVFMSMRQYSVSPNPNTFLLFLVYFYDISDTKSAEAIKEYMKRNRMEVGVNFYNGLFRALMKKNRFDELDLVLDEMKTRGIAMNKETYDILINAYSKNNQHARIKKLFAEMEASGIKPTTHTFNRMLEAMSAVLKPEDTKELLVHMSNEGLQFNSHTYTAIICNLIKQERLKDAAEMIADLGRKGIILSIQSYTKLIQLCSQHRLDLGVILLHKQMRKNEVPPNSYVYSALCKHYLRKRLYEKVDAILLEMTRKWNLKPNPFVYCSLLNHYVEALDMERIKTLIDMAKEQKIEINAVIYDVIMKCFYMYSCYQQGGRVARVALSDENIEGNWDVIKPSKGPICLAELKEQFEKTFSIPFRPTVHIYNEIMLRFFMREQFDGMEKTFQEMKTNDIRPNKTSYTFMLKARIFQGQIDQGLKILDEMVSNYQPPSLLHCALIFHSLCKNLRTEEAEKFLDDMQTLYSIKPNHVFYGSLIFAFTRRREYTSVFRIFERMEQSGFVPDTETCNYVLISLLEINELAETKKFLEKMINRGIPRNRHTYRYVAEGFLLKNDDAFVLTILSDCTAPGNIVDAKPFNYLLKYYIRLEKPESFVRVLAIMIDYHVQFDMETAPYLSIFFAMMDKSSDNLDLAIKIYRKALVDLPPECDHVLKKLDQKLRNALQNSERTSDVTELDDFVLNVPELKRIWTTIRPSILETFTQLIPEPFKDHGSASDRVDMRDEMMKEPFQMPLPEGTTSSQILEMLTRR